jgi:hypothetical protein
MSKTPWRSIREYMLHQALSYFLFDKSFFYTVARRSKRAYTPRDIVDPTLATKIPFTQ